MSLRPQKNKLATEAYVWRVANGLEEKIQELRDEINDKFNRVINQLVDIAGQFKKFDEERILIADRQRSHENRIEKLEKTIFKT